LLAAEGALVMENVWFASAFWMGLALLACLVSLRIPIAVALIEITIGAVAGNLMPLTPTEWVSYLASLGAVLLVFLAGAEINPAVFRSHFRASFGIGVPSYLVPYLGCMAFARYGLGWSWEQSQVAGLAMSTTSVAVVYAVVVETGLNRTTLGMVILAACFITDFATVATLGVIFVEINWWLAAFGAATAGAVVALPRIVPWLFRTIGNRLSEPEIRFVLVVLFALAGLAQTAKSEAILPAFLVGLALAPYFLRQPEIAHRMRSMSFAIVTPFFFLKAGSLIDATALWHALGLTGTFLALKMIFKFAGIAPVMAALRFSRREIMFTGLVMSSGLTFGSIVALFGLTNELIDRSQYAVLLCAVISSGVVPTIIAQAWFQPGSARL
jgi:Kef-type K+ transport system membrane component KefB